MFTGSRTDQVSETGRIAPFCFHQYLSVGCIAASGFFYFTRLDGERRVLRNAESLCDKSIAHFHPGIVHHQGIIAGCQSFNFQCGSIVNRAPFYFLFLSNQVGLFLFREGLPFYYIVSKLIGHSFYFPHIDDPCWRTRTGWRERSTGISEFRRFGRELRFIIHIFACCFFADRFHSEPDQLGVFDGRFQYIAQRKKHHRL